ncbi:sensor histidine kinase [Malaciobacter marinus]|uniref:sensor histidine kinase n=1 Tax=Malaciobacter marinus TaxID=505249 RepID=UPI000C074CC3|nr:ATP-binding protein [Malaciobacter marinus]PHO11739.1 histidine kinase [Malaciobacter marinus]
MKKQLKIRTKFIFLGIVGTIALIINVFMAIDISKLGLKSVNDVFKDSTEVQKIQQELIAPMYYLRELSLSLVIAPNDNIRDNINIKLEKVLNKLDEKFKLENKQIKNEWFSYKKRLEVTRGYIKKGFEEGAYINVNDDERKQFFILIRKLLNKQSKELQKSSRTFEQAKENITTSRFVIILVSLILGIFILFWGWFVIVKIAKSIEQLKKGHIKFFKFLKDKNSEDNIGIILDSDDELGDMARIINKEMEEAKDALHKDLELIESATKMLEELKQGNLNRRIFANAKSKELNLLKRVINEMVDNLENKIQQEINQRMQQEKLLTQQSKLASMGEMIGNIAHQWRQPLSELNAILMNVETRYKFGDFDDKFIENSVFECNEITSYMSNTISDFQNFFKPSKTKVNFNITKACNKAIGILQSSLKHHNIKYKGSCEQDILVYGYPNEFSQAILNILSNAKDVLIQRNIENPYIHIDVTIGKKYTLIHIKDNGRGIEEKYLDRIFEPYFTTKHAKQGTGIGLYMSKQIIEGNMDGILKVRNNKKGACFTIKLKNSNDNYKE